jgi:alkylated DNA repair dioxygenase AlkB
VATVDEETKTIVLGPGLVLLKRFLSLQQQQRVVDTVRCDGLKSCGFADSALNPQTARDRPLKVRTFCYGQQWSPHLRAYEARPGLAPLPAHLVELCQSILLHVGESTQITQIPPMVPDHAIVNFYDADIGNMRVHQDDAETAQSIEAGLPVVSVSVGDSAEFAFSYDEPARRKQFLLAPDTPMQSVMLESGDVLVFGGPARMIYHGVKSVTANTAPLELRMRPGRLNITLRQNAV